MSYEEKGAWVYLIVTLGTYGAYVTLKLVAYRRGL